MIDEYAPRNLLELMLKGRRHFPDNAPTRLLHSLFGVDIPAAVTFGSHVRFEHRSFGLVVHPHTTIGNRVRLYQGVTLGRSDIYKINSELTPGGGIVVGDDVVVCANATVLFRSGQTVTLGDGCVIGANSVVLCDVPAGEIWAGQPATRKSSYSPPR